MMATPLLSESEILALIEGEFEGYCVLDHPVLRDEGVEPDALALRFVDDLEIIGFEIKRTRPDWLVELRDPGKSFVTAGFCDYFYVVAAENVVKWNDLPSGWGLFVAHQDRKLEKVVQASRLTTRDKIGRGLAAKLIGNLRNHFPDDQKAKDAYDRGYRAAVQSLSGSAVFGSMDAEVLRAVISALNSRSVFGLVETMGALRDSAAEILNAIDRELASLPEVKDWETGGDLPPLAEQHKAEIEEKLLRMPAVSELARTNPDQFQRLVRFHVRQRVIGKPIL